MEYLIEHFQSFTNIYMTVIIELYFVMVAVLFAVWIKPFLVKQRSRWIVILIYHILQIFRTYLGTGKSIDSLITLFVIGVLFFSLWLLDDKRNPISKIVFMRDIQGGKLAYLGACYRNRNVRGTAYTGL